MGLISHGLQQLLIYFKGPTMYYLYIRSLNSHGLTSRAFFVKDKLSFTPITSTSNFAKLLDKLLLL